MTDDDGQDVPGSKGHGHRKYRSALRCRTADGPKTLRAGKSNRPGGRKIPPGRWTLAVPGGNITAMSNSLGTRLFTYFNGVLVGEDAFGNRYYREKNRPADWRRERRWVIYKGEPEGSSVPPLWQGWLTHTHREPPPEMPVVERPWEKPHIPNLTGTPEAYRPPGSLEARGRRERATGDYEPWLPE